MVTTEFWRATTEPWKGTRRQLIFFSTYLETLAWKETRSFKATTEFWKVAKLEGDNGVNHGDNSVLKGDNRTFSVGPFLGRMKSKKSPTIRGSTTRFPPDGIWVLAPEDRIMQMENHREKASEIQISTGRGKLWAKDFGQHNKPSMNYSLAFQTSQRHKPERVDPMSNSKR